MKCSKCDKVAVMICLCGKHALCEQHIPKLSQKVKEAICEQMQINIKKSKEDTKEWENTMKWYKWLALVCVGCIGFYALFLMPTIIIGNWSVMILHADWGSIYSTLKAGNYTLNPAAIVFSAAYWCIAVVYYQHVHNGGLNIKWMKQWMKHKDYSCK